MALKSYDQYINSLKKMRPNIYKWDQLIDDVTAHPATKRTVAGHGWTFKAAADDELREKVTTTSHLTGELISRYLSIIMEPEDMYANSAMKRLMFHLTGTCTGGRCAGWTALNSMFSTTWEMDNDLGTDYHQRFLAWLKDAQDRGNVQKVFMVHGEVESAMALADAARQQGVPEVYVPERGEAFDL